ncbi:MAG: hypothetical protein ACRYFR_05460 [Janthinobacterium lividum]
MDSWLNEKQQALSDFMSEISEEAWYAGWMEDLEYVLWYAMLHGPGNYGRKFIDEQTISQLKQLSEEAESWIIFDDGTRPLLRLYGKKCFEQLTRINT